MRSMRALQNALSRAGSHGQRGGWGHPSRGPLLGGGVRYYFGEAAAQGRGTPHSHQPQHSDHDASNSGMLPRLGDLLFYTIAEGQERIPIHKFTTALKATGLQTSDPRLQDCMSKMQRMVQESSSGGLLDRELFQKCVSSNIVLLTQAFRKKFVIPDFEEFTGHVDRIFEDAKELTGGKVAAYIPHLAKSNPDLWGVSLCTVDGQRHSVGHTKIPFCLQSCVKPLTYAISVSTLGTDYVHKFVGKEPSGLRYNKLSLNEEGIPHNPMVNAGAIVVSSLIKMDCNKAEKFDFVLQYLNKMAGNEFMGFSNATFQSEKETGDRNYAIGYYLKEKKCFPKGVDMMAALDLYFQNKTVVNLLFAAYSGDVSALRRFALSAVDMEQKDYDSRTALHVAAAEGHIDVVKFLIEACKVNPFVKDRWGNIPLDDAVQFNHLEVVKLLQDYHDSYMLSETQAEVAAETLSKENLESMV
uniref:glutaminase n=1 Tax=Rattus norvegicus TaxID=10116 RepID=A0A0S2EF49_RAT|nr:glutaminase variant 5 [Rattus norvegicus]